MISFKGKVSKCKYTVSTDSAIKNPFEEGVNNCYDLFLGGFIPDPARLPEDLNSFEDPSRFLNPLSSRFL